MESYSGFVKHLVLFLAVLHAVAGGHVFCPAHSAQTNQHAEYQETCCCSNDLCDGDHPCDGKEQPVIRTSRCVDETVKFFSATLSAFVSVVPEMYLPVSVGACDTISGQSSALPLRLHLLCGVLLI